MGATPNSAPSDDINVALVAMTTFQSYVQQAEAKINTLVVVHASAAVAIMAAQTTLAAHPRTAAVTALALFAAALLGSGYHLAQALRPRPHAPATTSRFGITGITSGRPIGAASAAEAWEMARVFAELAETKYRHIARAIPWTGATIALGVIAVFAGTL